MEAATTPATAPAAPTAIEPEHLNDGKVVLYGGDCRDAIRQLADNSVDSVVTDPPYALVSIGKRFGKPGSAPAQQGTDGAYARASSGFMGKQWDNGETAFAVEFWAEVYRVLKPGGHVVAFGGTRTQHRMVCAIEDAGFEIRDQLYWHYGSGFPKSHDVSKGIDKAAGAERKVVGTEKVRDIRNGHGRQQGDGINAANRDGPVYMERELIEPATPEAAQWQGWGTALKPATEPICLARKPLSEKSVAANVLKWGTGAINVDGCRVEAGEDYTSLDVTQGVGFESTSYNPRVAARKFKPATGRWPANIVHDGSDEVVGCFPTSKDGVAGKRTGKGGEFLGSLPAYEHEWGGYGGEGSAARFFYQAKADKRDRIGSKHPTVKPVDLMQWLVRMVTPPGGLVLDPFAGSGSTGEAALREGMRAVLCEREADYQADIKERMRLAMSGPIERRAREIKQTDNAGPLFGDNDNAPIGGQTDIRQVRRSATRIQEEE